MNFNPYFTSIKTILLTIVLLSTSAIVKAQCNSGCTVTIPGVDGNTYTINATEKYCITATGSKTGPFTTINAGGLLENCGTLDISNTLQINGGKIINYGTMSGTGVTLNLNSGDTLINYGDITITNSFGAGGMQINLGDVYVHNYGTITVPKITIPATPTTTFINDGTITVNGGGSTDFVINGNAQVVNNGTINISGTFSNNGTGGSTNNYGYMSASSWSNGREFNNYCSFIVNGGQVTGLGVINNYAYIEVNGGLLPASGQLGGSTGLKLNMFAGSLVITKNLKDVTWIDGPDATYGQIQVSNTTNLLGKPITGNVDICDANGIEAAGIYDPTVTFCVNNIAVPPTGLCYVNCIAGTVDAGANDTICTGSTYTLSNASVFNDSTFVWSRSGDGSFSNTGIIAPVYTPGATDISNGTVTLYLTMTDTCQTVMVDSLMLTILPIPTVNAGADDTVSCEVTTYTLSGNTPTLGSGAWTVTAGSATVTTPSDPNSGVTGLSYGNNTFMWSINDGFCTVVTDAVTIVRYQTPTSASAGPDNSMCETTTYTLGGNNPAVGSGTWTILNGGSTVTTPSQFNSGVTGLTYGDNTFIWTITNGNCPSSTDTVNIIRYETPTVANAGNDTSLCGSSIYTLEGNTPTAGSGLWTVITGSGIVDFPSSPTSTASNLGVGSNVFVWTISNGDCASSTDTVDIINLAPPAFIDAGPFDTLCETTIYTLAGNTPGAGVGTWVVVAGGSTVTNINNPTSGVTGLSYGTNTFTWSISNGGCPAVIDTVKITRSQTPTTATVGVNDTLCNTTTYTLNGNNPTIGDGLWTITAGSATVTTPTQYNSGVTGLSSGVNTFVWTISDPNNACPSTNASITIVNSPTPDVADAGTNDTLCNTTTYTLGGNNPTTGDGLWTVTAGSATVTAPTQYNSGVTGLSSGVNTFVWTISDPNNACPSTNASVTIVNSPTPDVADAGTNDTLCNTTTYTLGGNNPTIGNGAWTIINGGATVTNPTQFNSGVTGLTPGANVNIFVWTISDPNNSCPSTTDTVLIYNSLTPTVADAGPNDTICNNPNHNLSGNSPSVGNGQWTVIAGGGTVDNPANGTTTISGIGIGANTFVWTISDPNNACPSTSDTVVIINSILIDVADAGPNDTLCNTTTYTLAGNTPPTGIGTWSVLIGGATVTSPNTPTSGVTGLDLGQNTFIWTISDVNGVCVPSLDTVLIFNSPTPNVADAGADQFLCDTINTSLTGNSPGASIGTWTRIAGSGTIVDPTNNTSVVNGVGTPGVNTFVWTITDPNNACPATTDTVDVFMDPLPVATFSYINVLYCQNETTDPLPTFSGGGVAGTFTSNDPNLVVDSVTGAVDLSASTPTPNVYTVTNTIPASVSCPEVKATAIIVVFPVDDPTFSYPTGTFCLTGIDPLATVTGTSGGTFTITSPGVIDATTGTIDLSASGLGTFTIMYNTVSAGSSCPDSLTVQIRITDAPSTNFNYGGLTQFCQDSMNPVLTFVGAGSGGVFTVDPLTPPDSLAINPTTGAIDLILSDVGVYKVFNTIAASGGCASAIDSITIEVLQVDSALFSYPNTIYCETGVDPLATVTGTSGGTFTITSPGVIDGTTGIIDLLNSGAGVYTVFYNTALAGNPCAALDSVQITITPAPTAGFSYSGTAQLCQDSINPTLIMDVGATSGLFSATPVGLTIDSVSGSIILGTSAPGVYTVYNTVPAANGCAMVVNSTTLEVLQVDSATFSYGGSNTYCVNDSNPVATMGINATVGGEFTISSPGIIDTVTGEIDLLATGPGSYTIYYNTVNLGNPCTAIDSVLITINPQNTIVPSLSDTICLGDPLNLTATGSGNGTINWYSDVAGNNNIGLGSPFSPSITGTGTFTYYVREDGTCPSPMDSITIVVGGVSAVINATPITGPIPLDVFFGNGSTTGSGIIYSWDFGNGDTSALFEPNHVYTDIGNYTVTLTVTDGICTAITTITIDVFGVSEILIPNVFTPNGDGQNDVFTVKGVNLESVEGTIYNRWGQMMFKWDGIKGYWDGRTLAGAEAPDGTYFYIISAKGVDGEEYFKKGGFSLIR